MYNYEPPESQFDQAAPEFRCCCGSAHVTQGTYIIGVIQLILAVFCCVGIFFETELSPMWRSLEISSLLVEVAVLVALFFALKKADSKLLLPYLIFEGLWISFYIICVAIGVMYLLCILVFPNNTNYTIQSFKDLYYVYENASVSVDTKMLRIFYFDMFIIVTQLIIFIWWYSVVYKCYNYFKKLIQFEGKDYISMQHAPLINV